MNTDEYMTAHEFLKLKGIDPDVLYDETGITKAEKLDAECERRVREEGGVYVRDGQLTYPEGNEEFLL